MQLEDGILTSGLKRCVNTETQGCWLEDKQQWQTIANPDQVAEPVNELEVMVQMLP